jgi:hypothetical protein
MPTRLPAIQAVGKLFGMSNDGQSKSSPPSRLLPPANNEEEEQ